MNKDEQRKIIDDIDPDEKLCRTSNGIDWELESAADFLLAEGRKNTKKHSELRDYLSPNQLVLRRTREIYPSQGFPEKNLFSGMYSRAYNPKTRGETSSKTTPSMMDEVDHD